MRDTTASRKFIDLIHRASSKWSNWDPSIQIKVGDYGTIDNGSGELDVEGNIYEEAFQESLNKQGLKINLSDESCQPQKGGLDDNIIMSSSGVKQGDFSVKPEVSFLNLASASVKAEFQFQEDKRGAILVMHKPQQEYIPPGKVLNLVHKTIELYDKYLVTSTFTCPGYYIYLSNKSGERIALALTRNSVVWWTDSQPALTRKAVDNDGRFCYSPLYTLKQRGTKWFRRKYPGEEETDGMWLDYIPPWDPLDEDGNELHKETDEMRARKFIDLIFQASSKWANWNPDIEIKVGDYGTINSKSGRLTVEGNIYDAAFQESLNQQGLMINLSDVPYQPTNLGAVGEDIIMFSMDVEKGDFSFKPEASSLDLDSASVKAEFQFQEGKRGAALVIHKPQQEFVPLGGVLGIIHQANQLKDKYVVDSTLKCPAYFLYLSNKSREKISLALAASPAGVATDGEASVDWWTDAQAGFRRQAFDKAGQHRYTPIYTLKRMLQPLVHGAEEHLAEDDPRPDCIPPWDPLDEDGNELHEETDDMRARKFTDLIRQTSSKWANWDPAIEIKVGDYGTINRKCGKLEVQGNIYDTAFQESLNQQVEEDIVMSSTVIVIKEGDSLLKPEDPFIFAKAKFQFQEGKRGALLMMHKPQQQHIPQGRVLSVIHKANELKNAHLVDSTLTCQGYYICLSNRSGERISLALRHHLDWWTDAQSAFLRKAFDNSEQYRYTPLYTLKHRQNNFTPQLFHGEEEEETEDHLWPDCATPWQPLGEEGGEGRKGANRKVVMQRLYRTAEWENFSKLKMAIREVTGGNVNPQSRHETLTKAAQKLRELHRQNDELCIQLNMIPDSLRGAPDASV